MRVVLTHHDQGVHTHHHVGTVTQHAGQPVQHLVPRSRGGPDVLVNLRPACGPCNRQRGDMTLDEWRQLYGRTTVQIAPSRNWLGDDE